ncbi:hypothetical protein LTR78_009350 [Recurvomyces mirabilis]|uniref:Uncharacterized protein n=1 Tax=Recurvomyces mirabilis TaxID=574656 RepID=A0AAE0WIP2_9PEZI|nr:hypothetical protein LTR78_009350 [Recurvomyces mirabilis]
MLYSPVRTHAFSKRNILTGWSKAGLFPFNPERVLRDLQKPAPEALIDPPSTQEQSAIPRTPLTPVCVESLIPLQKKIVEQDARDLDDDKKLNLTSHLTKIVKATSTLYATDRLQKEQIHFLHKANGAAERRTATKSFVLAKGQGKVMSYDDLVEARGKREEKAVSTRQGSKKRCRMRGSEEVHVGSAGTETDTMIGSERHSSQEVQSAAPTAHMY